MKERQRAPTTTRKGRERTELDVALKTEEDVVALDISMNDSMLVKMAETLKRLPRDGSDLPLAHDVARNDVGQRSSLHVLHDDPEVALEEERVDVVDDVAVSRLLHDEDLVDDEILLRLLLEVHLLDRDAQVRSDLVRRVDSSRRSATRVTHQLPPHASNESRKTHPCPILTRFRYNLVGSASVQMALSLSTISGSLPDFFGSRLRG